MINEYEPTDGDPDGLADSRPNLRDSLMYFKLLIGQRAVARELGSEFEHDITVDYGALCVLVDECESLWRTLIQTNIMLTKAIMA